MALRLLVWGTIFTAFKAVTCTGQTGLIRADLKGSEQSESKLQDVFCLSYTPEFHPLPSTYKDQLSSLLRDFSHHDGCSDVYANVTGQVVAVARGNCTFAEKAFIIQSHGGVAAVVVDYANHTAVTPPGGNSTDYNLVNITVATILHNDFYNLLKVKEKGEEVRVWLYSPPAPRFDPNIIILFSLATLCVVSGAYLSANEHYRRKQRRGSREGKEEEEEEEEEKDTVSLGMGIAMSIGLVVFFCLSLTLLYFFYDYLVYVIIAIFCLAGVNGLFQALLPLWRRLVPCDARLRLPCCSRHPQIRGVVLVLLSAGFVTVWVVFRHQSYAWILQDIIGFCFCLYVMKALLMPSLRACTILLGLLFIYDIFFVFITPLFTKNGESVMIKVATGGNSKTGEQMPMVFKVPYFTSWAMSQCFTDRYSLLGYGDVIVPGLLLTYNCAFDLRTQHTSQGRWKLLYFTATSVAYVAGLVVTGAALYVMRSGQPALLYLVPCTVITTVVIAAVRKELGHMWRGHQCPKKNDDITAPAKPPSPTVNKVDGDGDDDDEELTTERQSLIQ